MMKNKRAQATAEIAIFGSLILLVLGALFNYTRTIREQQLMEQEVFRQALKDAYNHKFQVKDINGDMQENSGATVSYSKTLDKQANLLFEPGRRSYSSSYTVFWSNAEDPPQLNKMKVNQDDVSLPQKKITYFRSDEATDTSDNELEISAMDLIAIVGPTVASKILTSKTVENFLATWELGGWLPVVEMGIRLAAYAYFYSEYQKTVDELEEVEERRASLEDQDEQMGEWGWRVSTETKDGVDGIEAGKFYVKELDAQIYDTLSDSSAQTGYLETKDEDGAGIVNERRAFLTDTVNRNFSMRYDITSPDSTIEPSLHIYEELGGTRLSQGLGGDRNYSASGVDVNVGEEQEWVTPH